jgi:hypothetical protein
MAGIPTYPEFEIGYVGGELAAKFRREVAVPGWGNSGGAREQTFQMTERDLALRILAEGQNSPYAEMQRRLQERKSTEGKGLICARN